MKKIILGLALSYLFYDVFFAYAAAGICILEIIFAIISCLRKKFDIFSEDKK